MVIASTPRGSKVISVLLLENVHPSAVQLFEDSGFSIESLARGLAEDELCSKLRKDEVHVLGIRSKTKITAKVLQAGTHLLAVGCFCIGTNQVDLVAANAQGIPVFNAPFSNTRSVAELVIGEIIALARKLTDNSSNMHKGVWKKSAKGCMEVRGKTLGIVGYGHIGSQVGVLAETGLGMNVVFYDIITKLPLGNNKQVSGLRELLGMADFVTLHVPETKATRLLVGAAELATMRVGAHLINASRGSVVDIDELASALRSERLGGAALDVYPEEPEKNDAAGFATDVQGLPNVILTPHIGGSTAEAQAAIGQEVATALIKYTSLGTTHGAVNFPQIDLPVTASAQRVLNVHRNVPGVLRDINKLVGDLDANVLAQVLATDNNIGYMVMDLQKDVSQEVFEGLAGLHTNIRTRIVPAAASPGSGTFIVTYPSSPLHLSPAQACVTSPRLATARGVACPGAAGFDKLQRDLAAATLGRSL